MPVLQAQMRCEVKLIEENESAPHATPLHPVPHSTLEGVARLSLTLPGTTGLFCNKLSTVFLVL